MAGNKIEIDLSVQDKSSTLKKRVSEAKELNQELDRASKSIGGVGIPTGTKTGAQAMRASYSTSAAAERVSSDSTVGVQRTTVSTGFQRSSKQVSRQAAYSPTQGEMTDYNIAGGVTGRGGASARDFANQAQGLGGLVRLYAELFANIYAVGSAFNALREAMSTEIMIRGLDQLGAASGIAMGGLAKQFAAASDGAISLRESMEATAKAISSGLTTQQFLDIGQVAKGASQALGVNMSDAVSRLTRGITKLEPELLDELGIFTKTGKAAEDYARSVGKTEAQLTDFERRQAFANAVLKEGKDKFAEIAQAGNPYDQLLASFKNVAQDILTVVNTVVSPVAKILADNTGILTAAIGLFAAKIVGKVFPVISDYRDRLDFIAKDTKEKAAAIAKAASEREVYGLRGLEAKAGVPQASTALEAAKAREAAAISELQIAKNYNISLAERNAQEQKLNLLIAERIAAEKALAAAYERSVKLGESPRSFSPTAYIQEKNAKDAASKAARTGIVADVSRQFETRGVRESFASLNDQIKQNANVLTTWDKVSTRAAGTAAILGQGVSMVGGFLANRLLPPLSLAITTFEILEAVFSTNQKAVQEFDAAIQNLTETTKTAINVAEKYKNTLTVDSINAYANSLEGMADSLDKAIKGFDKAGEKSSWIDKAKDFLAVFWGGQRSKALADNLADTIVSSIEIMPVGALRDQLQDQLSTVLGTTDLSESGLTKQFEKLTDSLSDKELSKISKNVNQILQQSKKPLKDAQAVTQEVRETAKASETAFQNLANATKDNSPLTVFLANTIKQASALKKALDDSVGARGALDELTKKGNLEFLGPEVALTLAPLVEDYKKLQTESTKYNKTLFDSQKELKKLEIDLAGSAVRYEAEKRARANFLTQIVQDSKTRLSDIDSQMNKIADSARNLIKSAVDRQIDTSLANFKLRMGQLSVELQKSIVGTYKEKTVETAKTQTDLTIKSIDIQAKLADANMKLVLGIELLRVQVQRDADLREVQFYKESQARGNVLEPGDELRLTELEKRIVRAGKVEKAAGTGNINELSKLAKEDPTLFTLIQQLQGMKFSAQQFANQQTMAKLTGDIEQIQLKTRDDVEVFDRQIAEITRTMSAITDEGPQGAAAKAFYETQIFELKKQVLARQEKGDLEAAGETFAQRKAQLAKELKISPEKLTAEQIKDIAAEYDSVSRRITNQSAEKIKELTSTTEIRLRDLGNEGAKAAAQIASKQTIDLIDARASAEQLVAQVQEYAFTQLELQLDTERQLLDIKNQQGTLTQEEYRLANLRIQQQANELTLAKSLLEATRARDTAANQLLRDMAGEANYEDGGMSPSRAAEFAQRGEAIGQAYQISVDKAKELYRTQSGILGLNKTLDSGAKMLGDTWTQQFSKMTDALMNFINTGKFSFKDFMTSMLSDFIRTLLQMQMQSLATTLFGGPQVVGTAIKTFLGIPATPSAMGNAYSTTGMMHYALGGIPGYAMGGTFTNKIVNQPTLFKAANGLGVMGEAGPEAIMPLKRDSSGRLGVSGGGNDVSVVVNNYGKERAEVKESTDGRGNRRIEVVVGEMVSGELTRVGSPLQQTFTNTYGIGMPPGRR